MVTTLRFTSADLEFFPDDGKRYEIIDGELYVSKQPTWHHQRACGNFYGELNTWSVATDSGQASIAPGVIFADDDDVAPDVVWVRKDRLADLMDDRGHLTGAPDLVVEVLSPGRHNVHRDRDAKLKLYSRRGVLEYWIADWQQRLIEVYRREGGDLHPVATLGGADSLESPLLPGFSCKVAQLFS